MAQPKAFISSTFIDLKDIREHLNSFIEDYGIKPVLFEKDSITFTPDKPIDESCYKEVENADIFILIIGGRYGSPASSEKNKLKKGIKNYISVTKKEYLTAVDLGIPIHIFIEGNVLTEFHTYKKNKQNKDLNYAYVDDINIFILIEEIYNRERNNYLKRFASCNDIILYLQQQWAGMFKEYIDNLKITNSAKRGKLRINSYKVFYHRKYHKDISFNELSKRTGIDKNKLMSYERINKKIDTLSKHIFPYAEIGDIERLETYFRKPKGYFYTDRSDDFISQNMLYYDIYKGKKTNLPPRGSFLPFFESKVVVFDFDGTLTKLGTKYTTWEEIWLKLGYSINDCADYHRRFVRQEISHKEWCNITLQRFKEKKLSKTILKEIASDIHLIEGIKETLEILKENGVKMFIVSGSIDIIINEVLGDLVDYFIDISSNKFVFDNDDYLSQIIGTKFDFKGKADYLKELIVENEISPYEIMFIGNSCNDVWAYESGAQTLCVNPMFTDPNNAIQWNFFIRELHDLKETIHYILPKYSKKQGIIE